MKTIPLTKGFEAIVDDLDYPLLSNFKWYALTSGTGPTYAARKFKGKVRLMHREILGLTDSAIKTDHRDGNSLNNRRENLRPATDQQNQRAFLTPRKNKTSRFRGVARHTFSSGNQTWGASIQVSGKHLWLGCFSNEEDAARAYDAAARKYFGEFASTNYKL